MTPSSSTAERMDPQLSVVVATHDNLALLRRCLEGWRRHASHQPVEVIVVEDGCTDGTPDFLREQQETPWGRRHLRWLHTDDVHELACTNAGLAAARAPLVVSWHDDMFLQAGWMVPELLATFRAYPEIGMLALSRGLDFPRFDALPETWHESVDWSRQVSTIGPAPANWLRLQEVDGVIRPWVVRRDAVGRVGPLDEAYKPTEWDESDLAFRLREAGWLTAVHGYERGRAFHHAVNSTYGRAPSDYRMSLGLRNARTFFARWQAAIDAGAERPRRTWMRRATPAGWAAAAREAAARVLRRRRAA